MAQVDERVIGFYSHNPTVVKTTTGFSDYHVFSNWAIAKFTMDGKVYMATEQRMMEQKALLFGDIQNAEKVMGLTSHPQPTNKAEWEKWNQLMTQVKNLGRQVENFDDEIWTQKCEDIVYEANLAKFKQNLDMKKILLQTGEHILAEAARHDKIWGIGMGPEDPRVQNPDLWLGKNLLGKVLMRVRDQIRKEES